METLVYVLGFIIGALATAHILHLIRTRKLINKQHKLILELTFALIKADAKITKAEIKENSDTDCDTEEKDK